MANVILSFINGRKLKKGEKKPSVVELRMTYQKKVKYLSTGIKVMPNQFKNGVIVKHEQANLLNDKLNHIMARAIESVTMMEKRGLIDIEALPRYIECDYTNITFWDYIEKQGSVKDVRESTRKRYETFLSQIKTWDMFRTFADISISKVQEFDKMLHDLGYSNSTIHSYHKYLKQFVNDAKAEGLLKESPYDSKRISVCKEDARKDKFLTPEEVHALESVILPNSLTRVRDMFIFQIYTGLAFSDMLDFSKEKVSKVDGQLVLEGKRIKDDVDYIVPLLPQALAIAKKYNWCFETISNAKYNEYLKIVALRAEVDKPISSHWARHTAGMLLLNNNVPIEIVSRMLGHANINTTQKVYAQIQVRAVVREIQKYQKSI